MGSSHGRAWVSMRVHARAGTPCTALGHPPPLSVRVPGAWGSTRRGRGAEDGAVPRRGGGMGDAGWWCCGLQGSPACGPGVAGTGRGAGGILPSAHHNLQNGVRWRCGAAPRVGLRAESPPPPPSPQPGEAVGSAGRRAESPSSLLQRPAGAAAAAPPAAPPSCRGARARRRDGRAGRAVTANGEWVGIKWSQDDRRAGPPLRPPPPLPRARRDWGTRAGAGLGAAASPPRTPRTSASSLRGKGTGKTTRGFGMRGGGLGCSPSPQPSRW